MKTIRDLVDRLNSYVAYGEYYVRQGKAEEYLLCKRYMYGSDSTLLAFAKKQPYWDIYSSLGAMNNRVQRTIMDFIYTTDSNHWFDEPEKKYNIIIGKDVGQIWKSAYKKSRFGGKVSDNVYEEDLILNDYQFTESEIEDLKSNLPENMAKIVELGKVEVKDD